MKSTWEQFAQALIARFGGVPKRVERQRRATLATPFPGAWTEILNRRSQHYRRLPPAHRQCFEQQIQIFLSEKRITGVDVDLVDELKLLVAASGVSLTAGWPDYTWDQLSEVIVYPQDFDRDYSFDRGHVSGLAHQWGVVILSLPALNRSFEESSDAYHVGFHEFAHLLDLAGTRFDGIPSYLDDDSTRRWVTLLEQEAERIECNDSILDPYALSSPVELFAVSVEAFFETAIPLADRHADLYRFLAAYFSQDPAAWSRDSHGRDEGQVLFNPR
jgi:Mlc titration factor MtfA (ptsG expression regulator)